MTDPVEDDAPAPDDEHVEGEDVDAVVEGVERDEPPPAE
jgi:hypothetical protein